MNQFKKFCTGSETNCTKGKIELQHIQMNLRTIHSNFNSCEEKTQKHKCLSFCDQVNSKLPVQCLYIESFDKLTRYPSDHYYK